MSKKSADTVNYFYFGFILISLICLHMYHIFLIGDVATIPRIYFLFAATAQCIMEVMCLVVLTHYIRRYFPRIITFAYLFFTFMLFMCHLIDLPLNRILGMSIWYTFDWIAQESMDNFIEMLSTTTLSISYWICAALIALSLPIVGTLFFRFTEKLSRKTPIPFSLRSSFIALGTTLLALSLLDLSLSRLIDAQTHEKYRKTLPWKTPLISPNTTSISLASHLNEAPNELPSIQYRQANSKPNIFLFIAESIRDDYITEEIAPNLLNFKRENISFDTAIANGNATNISWFSLFHSKFPFYFGKINADNWESGGIPLQILKEMGYKIHVYTASNLGFYRSDELIFGKDLHLIDDFNFFQHKFTEKACYCDAKAFDKLKEDLAEHNEEHGHIYITFLDSTHFCYSWPDEHTKFTPYCENVNHFTATFFGQGVEEIKNRYKNSLAYLDYLFGNWVEETKKSAIWDDSIVIFTGDHGEEFLEKESLFHASYLTKEQTHIALYYKFGKNSTPPSIKITSQVDIFPSIIHHVCADECHAHLFDGNSIFSKNAWPYAISARQNQSRAPFEFFIHDGKRKLVARFPNEREIYDNKSLRILSVTDSQDRILEENEEMTYFIPALAHLFAGQ